MAGSNEVRAGKAYVEASVKDKTKAGLDAIEARLKKVGESISSIGQKMMTAGLVIAAGFVPAIKAASELEETMNKFTVVFGDRTNEAKKWSDDFAKEVGRSKQQVLDFMSSTQGLIVPLGFDRKEADEISRTLTRLAVDLASFNNTSDEDALAALKSGLLGEAEPMKKFGVILNETALKAELLARKIKPEEATSAEKTYARLAIIMRSTADAQGDATRSAGSFANMFKRLEGEATDAAAAIGSAVLPMVTSFVSQAATVAKAIGDWGARNQSTIQFILKIGAALTAVGAAVYVFGTIATAAGALIPVIKGVAAAIGVMTSSSLAFLATPMGIVLAGVALTVAALTAVYLRNAEAIGEVSDAQEQAAAAHDKERAAHQAAIERLEQLNQKTALNSEEQAEAARLVDLLNQSYDGLGISIDGVTGKVTGLTDAQKQLSEQMKAAAMADVNAQLAESGRNLDILRQKQQSPGFMKWAADTVTFGGTDMTGDHIRGIDEDIAVQMKKQAALLARLDALKAGDKSAVTGNPAGKLDDSAEAIKKRTQDAKQKSEDAAKEEAKLKQELHDLELRQIEDEYKRDIALINNKYDLEAARLKEIGADTAAMEKMRQIELDNAAKQEKERQAEAKKDREEAATKEREEKERTDKEAWDRQKDRWELFQTQTADALDAEAAAAEKRGDKSSAEHDRGFAKDIRRQIEDFNLEKQMNDLGFTDAQKQRMRDMQKRIRAAQDQQPVSERTYSSAGIFNARAIGSLQGNSLQDRIAKASERTAKNTEEMKRQKARFG